MVSFVAQRYNRRPGEKHESYHVAAHFGKRKRKHIISITFLFFSGKLYHNFDFIRCIHRYSGKTQKQIVEFVRENYVKRQAFQRWVMRCFAFISVRNDELHFARVRISFRLVCF